MDESGEPWLCYHLYYHEDLSRAILRFVRPAVASLVAAGSLESFFFIRYGLGGPHLRLRLLPAAGRGEAVAAAVEARAGGFLAEHPSTSRLDREALRRGSEAIVAADPHEVDAAVYPDNSFLALPFRPEVERYGGPERLAASLDFFAVSSAAALEVAARHEGAPRSRLLGVAFSLLVRQALGFAAGDAEWQAEWQALVRYGVDSFGGAMPAIVAKADGVLAAQGDAFRQLFDRELALLQTGVAAGSVGAAAWLGEAARRLSLAVGMADAAAHRRIGISQLHMTANRLGLSNPEEVYLSRILAGLSAERLAGGSAAGSLREALGGPSRPAREVPGLGALLAAATG